MKTNPAPILLAAVVFLAAGMLGSCGTTAVPPEHAAGNAASMPSRDRSVTRNWVKVRDKPPVWVPRGVAADVLVSSDHRNGEWVFARDDRDTRFYIPLHGLPHDRRDALVREALAMRDAPACRAYERQWRREEARENTRKLAREAPLFLVKLPFLAGAGVLYALGAQGWTPPAFGCSSPPVSVSSCGAGMGAGCGGH